MNLSLNSFFLIIHVDMSVGSSVDIYYICNFVVYIERENDYTSNRIISLEQTSQNAISTDLFLGWRGGGCMKHVSQMRII